MFQCKREQLFGILVKVPILSLGTSELGYHFDCPMSNSKEMVNCLRKISAEKLHEAHYELFFKWHKDSVEREPMNVFSPR